MTVLVLWTAAVALPVQAAKSPHRAGNHAGDAQVATVDPQVYEAAVERLRERQRQRKQEQARAGQTNVSDEAQQAASVIEAAVDDGDPYALPHVTARKMEMLKDYEARITSARSALRQRVIPASEVRQLVEQRAALCGLPLDRFRELMIELDQQNAGRLQRYQEAFGDLPAAARTVVVILMKSGQIDFATALPEDPLTREVEEARGVRRVYFQFYLHPPEGSPRRYNGWVEFVYETDAGLWVPTWTDYSGTPVPLFDAEAFVPLRPYEIAYDGKRFAITQSRPARPPEVFALLTPRWAAGPLMVVPRDRW